MYRFIHEIIEGKLVVSKKKKDVLVKELRERNYEAFPKGSDQKKAKPSDEEPDQEEAEEEHEQDGGARDYDYLLSVWRRVSNSRAADANALQMPIWALTLERLEKLKKQIEAKKAEHDELEQKSE